LREWTPDENHMECEKVLNEDVSSCKFSEQNYVGYHQFMM